MIISQTTKNPDQTVPASPHPVLPCNQASGKGEGRMTLREMWQGVPTGLLPERAHPALNPFLTAAFREMAMGGAGGAT